MGAALVLDDGIGCERAKQSLAIVALVGVEVGLDREKQVHAAAPRIPAAFVAALSTNPSSPCASEIMSAARSPITTQGAMVLPTVILGMIDASATRSPSTP